MGQPPPRGTVIGKFEVVFQAVYEGYNSVTVAGDSGTGHFRLPPETAGYTKKGDKVILSLTEYKEE